MDLIEIMAPVGSYESLMAAIQGGADSVYFGMGKLNMRSRSTHNFSPDDLDRIVDIANQHKIKTYITLNTIIYDDDIDEMKFTVERAKSTGITAIIASDMSVIQFAHGIGMEVHISTQCNISNLQAVKFYSRYADVVVTARELNLSQVARINEGIEKDHIYGPSGNLVRTEIFVHGALCMAISGKCYLSLDNMNYSANRGACLQLCRRAYTVRDRDEGYELDIENEYIMSPKDLCTIGFIDKIINAGVRVLKIEGRGRSPEYVKTVTQTYRQAASAVLDGTYTQNRIEEWMTQLKSVYNRGFWDGYYLGRKTGEWSVKYGSQATRRKVYIGKVTNYFSKLKVAEIRMESYELAVGEDLLVLGPTTGVVDITPDEIRVNLEPVAIASKGQLCSVRVPHLVRRGDKVYKLVNEETNKQIT